MPRQPTFPACFFCCFVLFSFPPFFALIEVRVLVFCSKDDKKFAASPALSYAHCDYVVNNFWSQPTLGQGRSLILVCLFACLLALFVFSESHQLLCTACISKFCIFFFFKIFVGIKIRSHQISK